MDALIQVSTPMTWGEALLMALVLVGTGALLTYISIRRHGGVLPRRAVRRRRRKHDGSTEGSWLLPTLSVLGVSFAIALLTLVFWAISDRLLTLEMSGDTLTATYERTGRMVIDRSEIVRIREYTKRGVRLQVSLASGRELRTPSLSQVERNRVAAWAGLPPAPGYGKYRRWERPASP
jgi:hypothetical protein